MREYVEKNVLRYLDDTKTKRTLKRVETPLLTDANEPLGCTREPSPDDDIPSSLRPHPTLPFAYVEEGRSWGEGW